MWVGRFCVCFIILVCEHNPVHGIFLVIPEDVATGLAAIYGFSPKLIFGNDHRFGFGFRFGNHADLQILYEFGPQITTNSVTPPKIRSAPRQRSPRRRPFVEFLLRAGLLKEATYDYDYNTRECDEPR